MTQLTYTIAHIKVGAEKYWKEVEGFVSNDLTKLKTPNRQFTKMYNSLEDDYVYVEYNEELNKNTSLPLSPLTEKLGATIYGGFEDEKDFYVVMPTVGDLKVGGVLMLNSIEEIIDLENLLTYIQSLKKLHLNISDYLLSSKANTKFLNIFQEYARTGILENELYKQFFK